MSFAVNHLTKKFGPKTVLQDFSLTVNGPLVLMGPSGCGKTTLLRILMGLETADEGAVQAPVRVAAVFQENRLCPQLTSAANITLPGGSAAAAEAELRALGFTDRNLRCPAQSFRAGRRGARRCCGRCCAPARRPCCLTNPSPAWMPPSSARHRPRSVV